MTHHDRPLRNSLLFILLIVVTLACIGASSVQSIGGADETYFISTIAGTGAGALKVNVPALDAKCGLSNALAQSKNGDIFVASQHNVVLKFEFDKEEGTWSNVTIIAGTGFSGKGSDGVEGTQSTLNNPSGLSLIENANGDVTAILIADLNNHRIRKLDMSTRIITTIAGTGKSGFSGDGSPAKDAQLWFPRRVYYDKTTGDVYIADSDNNRIRRARGGTISTVVGKTCTGSDGLGDGGQATDACLKNPYHFTMNGAREWFIADYDNSRIRKVDSTGIITTVAGGGTETEDAVATSVQLTTPNCITVMPSGEMLSSQSTSIRKMDNSGFMKIIAGGGSEVPSPTGPIPAKTANISPRSIAYARDGSDAFFIGDSRGFIFMVSNRTKCYGVWADNSAVCSGQGSCIGPDECECDSGWTGHNCSVAYCFDVMSNETSICSGHGSCIGVDECKCNSEWMGADCSITHCFDTMSNETSACSGHGVCMGPDACECDDGWSETNCSVLLECFDIKANDKSVCSGRGSCVATDQCHCDDGWMHVDCSVTHCYGVTSNLPDRVCSGKGQCVRHNKCHCDKGFRGHKCHKQIKKLKNARC